MIQVLKGDLAGLDFDIVVNEANTELLPGGGVCQTIFQRAGTGLITELARLAPRQAGEAVMTDAYRLPASKIIHTVTPIYMDGSLGEEDALRKAWKNTLELAFDWFLEQGKSTVTIGFPALGCGLFGFECRQAARIAQLTLHKLGKARPEMRALRVVIVAATDEEYRAFKEQFS